MCRHRMWRHLPFLPPSLLSQSMSRRLAMIAPSLLLWQIHIESITIYIYIYIYIYICRYLCHVQGNYISMHQSIQMSIYIYISVCVRIYSHTHIYIYIYHLSHARVYILDLYEDWFCIHTRWIWCFFFVLLSSAQSCPRALPHINSSGKVERHRWSHRKVSVEQARTIRWCG